jgi:hypothetical protein
VYVGLDDADGALLVSTWPISDPTGLDLLLVLVYSLNAKAAVDQAMQVGGGCGLSDCRAAGPSL